MNILSSRKRSLQISQIMCVSVPHAMSGVQGKFLCSRQKYLYKHRASWFRALSANQLLISVIYATTLTFFLSAENVQCDRCKKYFHMSCVQPPLQAKPSRGYGWTCAPCSRKHEEEVDSHDVRYPTPPVARRTNAPPVRGRGRPRKDRAQAEREENFPVKHFNMWPFRYFG